MIERLLSEAANRALNVLAALLFPRRSRPQARRVLVFRSGFIGDVVVAIPALRHIRRNGRQASIWLVTLGRGDGASMAGQLLRGTGLCDCVLELDPRVRSRCYQAARALRRQIQGFRPERVVVLPYSGESFIQMARKLLLLRTLGAAVRPEGCRFDASTWLALRGRRGPEVIKHQAATALEAAGAPGVLDPGDHGCQLPEYPEERLALGQILRQQDLPGDTPWLLAAPSAKFPHKRWPVERFAEVINRVRRQWQLHPVLVGGPEDRPVAERLGSLLEGASTNLCGRLELRQTAELARRAAAFLGNDGGPAHIAAAARLPSVVVFSGIHYPGVWEPWSESSVVVRAAVTCQGCRSEFSCPTATMQCLRQIAPEDVAGPLEEILGSVLNAQPACRAGGGRA